MYKVELISCRAIALEFVILPSGELVSKWMPQCII